MLKNLFGTKETLEEIIIKKPFDENFVDKRFSKYKIEKDNHTLLNLCAEHNCAEAILYLVRKQNINVNTLDEKGRNALFTAIKNASENAAKALLVCKIDFEHKDLKGTTAFHLSAKYLTINIFNILAKNIKDIKQEDNFGRNILFYSVQSKNIQMVKKVLEITDIDINCKDKENNTISHLKDIFINREMLDELLKMGLSIDILNNRYEDFIYINCLDLNLDDNLIDLALKKATNLNKNYELRNNNILRRIINKILSIDIQILENKSVMTKYQDRFITFLGHGIDVNSVDQNGENILFEIVRHGNIFVLDFILNRTKVNINQVNTYNQSLLDVAIFYEKPNLDIIKTLIYSDIDCTIKDKDNYNIIEKLVDMILSEAIPNRSRVIGKLKEDKSINYTQILTLILDYSKIDINTITFEDEPIIFEVAKSFYVPLLEIFKKYGADFNIINGKDKLNIYYKVLEVGKNAKDEKLLFLRTLNFLVSNNVNLEYRDSYGGTVIHKAILEHDLSIISILIKKMVDFTARDKKGRTYIHNCVWSDKVDILKKIAFKDRKIVNIPDKFGVLPINYAVIMGKKDIVFTLIQLGAFLNNPNKINGQFKEKFFSKLGKLEDILNSSMTKNERGLMTKLVQSMQEELEIS